MAYRQTIHVGRHSAPPRAPRSGRRGTALIAPGPVRPAIPALDAHRRRFAGGHPSGSDAGTGRDRAELPRSQASDRMISRRSFRGQAASFGIALGLSYRVDIPPAAVDAPPQLLGDPVERVVAAFDAVAAQLLGLAETLRRSGQPDLADIVEVNGYIAKDRELRENALRRIRDDDAHAAHAVAQAVYEYAEAIGSLNDATLAERATDVRQVGRRVLAQLSGSFSAAPDGPLVLCAREIGAADLLERGDMVVAAVSMLGGPNGHASIIARSLGIPLLLGVDRELLEAPDGTEILVDTARSRATVHPAVDERADAIAAMNGARRRREALALERGLPCRTLDGH